eukprot:TRINITY_DN3999_c0_g1_i1.p2 TRINITY_DN3999_c0_g1~~TRINITY_DN3999_c0_g1_i1.p2  ORF type:complete len:181 (+),score=46.34 TRINITY_DN3999_c0_g1_i1:53-595(+)
MNVESEPLPIGQSPRMGRRGSTGIPVKTVELFRVEEPFRLARTPSPPRKIDRRSSFGDDQHTPPSVVKVSLTPPTVHSPGGTRKIIKTVSKKLYSPVPSRKGQSSSSPVPSTPAVLMEEPEVRSPEVRKKIQPKEAEVEEHVMYLIVDENGEQRPMNITDFAANQDAVFEIEEIEEQVVE